LTRTNKGFLKHATAVTSTLSSPGTSPDCKTNDKPQTKLLMKRFFPLFFCVALSGGPLWAQESADAPIASVFLPDTYYEAFNIHLPIYNGRIFTSYPTAITGYALFPETRWTSVSVQYDGIWYKTVGRYDRYADELIIRNPDSTCTFVLNRSRVNCFLMEGKTFVKLDTPNSKLTNGYYELITNGPFAVYSKHVVTMNEDISGPVVERSFVQQKFFYVRKNGLFHQIRTKANFNDVIKDKKREILQALREDKLTFKKDPETTLKSAALFYK
jgi:hypothetical protein